MKRERAVWNDEEDDIIASRPKTTKSYGSKKPGLDFHGSLRAEFQYAFYRLPSVLDSRSVFGNHKWATKKDDEFVVDGEDSDFESFLASTSVANAITRLKSDQVKMRRRQDLNIDARSTSGPVGSISWQPLGESSIESNPIVAFSTMKDREVRLCRVSENGKSSQIEYSLQIKKLISPSVIRFVSDSELLITNNIKNGRVLLYNIESQSSYSYSTLAGKGIVGPRYIATQSPNVFSIAYDGGNVVNIDKRSKQFVSELRLNNACVGLGWASKSDGLLYLGDEKSNLYQFDLRLSKCVKRIQLETTSALTNFSLNGDSLMACGSPFGTVDIVDTYSFRSKDCAPIVSFDRLVTKIDSLAFHPIHRSMLVASSMDKKNALRVYECGNGKTLQGWPSDNEPIGRARELGFSDCGRFLAVGCKSGRVQMYAVQY
jgi:hypothetical protein